MTRNHIYQPSDEFRTHLEWEVARRFRQGEAAARERVRSARWAKAAALVGVSIAIGASAGFASAQIRQTSARDSLLEAARAEAMLAKLRFDLAQVQADDVSLKVRAGMLDERSLASATSELRDMEAKRNRVGLNIEEINATGQPPRDDLGAPLVGGRDYVKLRTQLDAMSAQSAYADAEAAQADLERRARIAPWLESQRLTSAIDLARAKARLSVLAERLALRAEFLDKGTAIADLTRRLDRAQLNADAIIVQAQLDEAKARLEAARKKNAAGTLDNIALLKAQIDVLSQLMAQQGIATRLKQGTK